MNKDKITLAVVSGGGCAGCEALVPEARAAAEELGLKFSYTDAESHPEILSSWALERTPATLLFDGDKPVCKCYGYQPREILTLYLEEKLNEYYKENDR